MNILFNASVSGLGNNGGTKTIIKSVETLRKLGHNADIWYISNFYTWGDVPDCSCVPRENKTYDVVVNVSVYDVDTTLSHPCKNKVWWVRGLEQWVNGIQHFFNKVQEFTKAGGKIIVNSSWLKEELGTAINIQSEICFSGLDLGFWRDFGLRRMIPTITIGALWNAKHTTKNYSMFQKLETYYRYNQTITFRTLRNNLNDNELLKFYNECDVWLALSNLEGFHQCPAEAALCGCLIVYNDTPSGGTSDYCNQKTAMPFHSFNGDKIFYRIDDVTGKFVPVKTLIECIDDLIFSRRNYMEKFLRQEKWTREFNMEKFVELLKKN